MAASPAPAGGSVTTVVTETIAGSHVLMTVYGFCKLKNYNVYGNKWWITSEEFRTGGHTWFIEVECFGNKDGSATVSLVSLELQSDGADDGDVQVKAHYEVTLLNRAAETIIWSTQGFYTFSYNLDKIRHDVDSPLVGDSFQVMCNITFAKEFTAARPPELHRHLGGLLANQVGVDVTFDVGGELFPAHRCVLAARSPVFMAELFGNTTTTHVLRINGVEPRVFRALLHFIYTDTLPEVNQGDDDDDKVAMAQGLLVAADRYGVERLKLICADVLCNCIDARTAMALLELADKHGCHRLKEACIKTIKLLLAKVADP